MLIPALDLIDGEVVRLYQGDYGQKTRYAINPEQQVAHYIEQGAKRIHIVDLTGAKSPDARQTDLIARICEVASVPVQAGGGVRRQQDIDALLDVGVTSVVIGSLAVSQTELVATWIQQYGSKHIVVALDINIDDNGNKWVATHGWETQSNTTLEQVLVPLIDAGLVHVLCTDISKDGTLKGSNVELYKELAATYPQIKWQSSGGIGSLDDIAALKPTNVNGVILGKSLLEGKFTVEEAISCWQDA